AAMPTGTGLSAALHRGARSPSGFLLGGSGVRMGGVYGRLIRWLLQLGHEEARSPFDGLPRWLQQLVNAGRHCGTLGRGGSTFRDGGFCQGADAVDHLSRIEAALAGEALPVSSGEVVPSALAGDRLREVLRDVAPH